MAKQIETAFTENCPSWIKERVTAACAVLGADVRRIFGFLDSLPPLDGTPALLFSGNGYSVHYGYGDAEDGTVDFVNVYSTTALPDGKRLLSQRPVAAVVVREAVAA